MRFTGHVVLITGASAGVGLATARAFYAEGAHVVLLARGAEGLAKASAGMQSARCLTIAADVADTYTLAAAVDETVAHFGGLDGLVNNAGTHFRGPMVGRTHEELATMVDVNLRAPVVLSRLAIPELRVRKGFIVNVASLAGKVPLDGAATYSATKFGLRALSFALHEELADTGIRVSAVSPGPVRTGFIMDALDEVEDIVFSQPMCTAEDVAAMILDCAVDGERERQFPLLGGRLATLSYLVPQFRRWLKPTLEARGARVKARLKRQR